MVRLSPHFQWYPIMDYYFYVYNKLSAFYVSKIEQGMFEDNNIEYVSSISWIYSLDSISVGSCFLLWCSIRVGSLSFLAKYNIFISLILFSSTLCCHLFYFHFHPTEFFNYVFVNFHTQKKYSNTNRAKRILLPPSHYMRHISLSYVVWENHTPYVP